MKDEAAALLQQGIHLGLFSDFADGGVPKYVWSVDEHGRVFEAKTRPEQERAYHGYCLNDDDDWGKIVLREWEKRCQRD